MVGKILTIVNLILLIVLSILSFIAYEKSLKNNMKMSAYRMRIATWLIGIATGIQITIVFSRFGGLT